MTSRISLFISLFISFFLAGLLLLLASPVQANSKHCGDQGVWVEILGAGSGELDDGQASPSYLIWHDNVARVLIDVGSGAQIGFEPVEIVREYPFETKLHFAPVWQSQ